MIFTFITDLTILIAFIVAIVDARNSDTWSLIAIAWGVVLAARLGWRYGHAAPEPHDAE